MAGSRCSPCCYPRARTPWRPTSCRENAIDGCRVSLRRPFPGAARSRSGAPSRGSGGRCCRRGRSRRSPPPGPRTPARSAPDAPVDSTPIATTPTGSDAQPSSEASDMYRLTNRVRANTGTATSSASGRITSIVPASVTTPRPPPSPRNIDRHEPMTAPRPATDSTDTLEPPAIDASHTGRNPFNRSPRTTTAAPRGPSARSAFVVPVRPEPTVRGSGPPTARATSTPTGTDPQA